MDFIYICYDIMKNNMYKLSLMKLNYWFITLLFLGTWSVSAQEKVECWGRYEVSLQTKVKGNPFETELTALFEGPDTTITVR